MPVRRLPGSTGPHSLTKPPFVFYKQTADDAAERLSVSDLLPLHCIHHKWPPITKDAHASEAPFEGSRLLKPGSQERFSSPLPERIWTERRAGAVRGWAANENRWRSGAVRGRLAHCGCSS